MFGEGVILENRLLCSETVYCIREELEVATLVGSGNLEMRLQGKI